MLLGRADEIGEAAWLADFLGLLSLRWLVTVGGADRP